MCIRDRIIEFLSMHPGQVFDKERIYAQVCGYDTEGDSRTITELVCLLYTSCMRIVSIRIVNSKVSAHAHIYKVLLNKIF